MTTGTTATKPNLAEHLGEETPPEIAEEWTVTMKAMRLEDEVDRKTYEKTGRQVPKPNVVSVGMRGGLVTFHENGAGGWPPDKALAFLKAAVARLEGGARKP